MFMKLPLLFASFYGLTGVILGAFGAHALKGRLTSDQLASWETGVRYQLVHAVALLVVAVLIDRGVGLKPTVGLMGVGTALFSGSIYLLCLDIGPKSALGPATPLGGLCLILGWGGLLIAAWRM